MSVEDVTEILAIDLLGVIPDDESVVIATNQGRTGRRRGKSGRKTDMRISAAV